ncbi:MAG: hypothetical protein A2934_04290 [Candidatus Sungbacteria bacterium RIFCSPLOWO2_01_FULL_47_10]|uniref:Uncharacterized protein n=1 Tax=Candidatus Sungbacteria bacterium RIFCSPLOWO2_01_FULL_47_10 TaxID=1802276 RepID=A0A1G2KYQ3_9BACT|nr:MAG: hypothetical protein A2934_04290 [Candidatus Sungbacteria bacterium RIFCSPLOWO2_01_FULL_47_10]
MEILPAWYHFSKVRANQLFNTDKSPHHGLTSVVFIYALCDCPPFIHGFAPVDFWWGIKQNIPRKAGYFEHIR